MPYARPTDDDIAALHQTVADMENARSMLQEADARLDLVADRLSTVVPPDPCPDCPPPVVAAPLPAVGVGGSGAFGGLTTSNQAKVLDLMRACGITHFRFDVQWAAIEKVKGQYNLTGIVAKARRVIDAGLIPMVLVGWVPPFYRQQVSNPNSAPTVAALPAWEKFLRALMGALFDAGVRRFEIWNEPNGLFFQPVIPALWADLVLIASDVASAISRQIVVIAGGVCPRPNTPPTSMNASAFYDAVIAHEPHFFRYVDEVGIHPYAGDHTKLHDGQFWKLHVEHIASLKPAEVPFCGTEHGWKSGKNTEPERAALYVDTVATWTDDAPVYIFSAFDFAEPYGLLKADFTPKLAYDALKALLT